MMIYDDLMNWVFFSGFTGIDQAYEEPNNPELIIKSGELSIDECVHQVAALLQKQVNVIK